MKSSTSRILRLPAVTGRVGLGRDSIYRLIRQGAFPAPLKLGERASGWYEHEVDEYIAARAALRTAGTA